MEVVWGFSPGRWKLWTEAEPRGGRVDRGVPKGPRHRIWHKAESLHGAALSRVVPFRK